ncbi:hypothetical protein Tco_0689191 [Tanacetum coccineum]
MKAKLALLEAGPSTSQNPKAFQPKNKCLIAETFDWDEEEVLDDEEVTQVKENILLSMDEDDDWQNYLKYINIDLKYVEEQRLNLLSKYNKIVFELNKCRDELLVLKQAKLEAVTFQIQYTELTKLNHTLQEQLKEERKINEKWLTSSKRMCENQNDVKVKQIRTDNGIEFKNSELEKAIIFTNTSIDEIGIDDSFGYPPHEYHHEDDPSRQYQSNSDISYYIIPHGHSLIELTQEKHVLEDEQNITQPTEDPSGQNTEVLVSIIESSFLSVPQSYISNQASTSSHPVSQDRWSKDQHIKLVNIIGDPGKGMLTRSMAAKLTAASASV